jgi:hypothetical protein
VDGAPLLEWHTVGNMPDGMRSWFFQRGRNHLFVAFPFRLPVAVAILLAAAFWIFALPRRFSLRTLLIVTTLIAIMLGLVVYLVD